MPPIIADWPSSRHRVGCRRSLGRACRGILPNAWDFMVAGWEPSRRQVDHWSIGGAQADVGFNTATIYQGIMYHTFQVAWLRSCFIAPGRRVTSSTSSGESSHRSRLLWPEYRLPARLEDQQPSDWRSIIVWNGLWSQLEYIIILLITLAPRLQYVSYHHFVNITPPLPMLVDH